MPNPNRNNENNLTEAKKNLTLYEQQFSFFHFDDEALDEQHRRFTEALHVLSEETDRYYTKDAQGNYPVLDEAAFAQFDNLYRQVYAAAASLKAELQQSNKRELSNNDESWKSAYGGLVDDLQDVLGRDLQHLHGIQRQGNETLPTLIEQARTHSYNIDGQRLEKVGGNMSSRLGMSIPGPDGERRGFFTESASRMTEEEEMEQLKRAAIAKNPKMEALLADFDLDAYLNAIDEGAFEDGVFDESVHFPESVGFMFGNRESFARMNEVYEDFNAYRRQVNLIHNKYDIQNRGKLGDNDRTDLRNCAMSTVADLLGMNGLLAHAEPVEITYTENGKRKTMKGSFMQSAEGEDPKRQVPGKGLLQPNAPLDSDTASLKQQLSDLQVLDYICGNIDRHVGNMFYKLDETDKAHPKLVGIQGIDNDASFSLRINSYNNMIAPENMTLIRRKTADLVMGLTPDMLKTMLRNFNLNQEQLDAVWTRTHELQQAIQAGKDFYRDKAANALVKHQLRVLEDEDFENFRIASLDVGDRHDLNYFKRVVDATNVSIDNYIDDEKTRLKKEAFDAHGAFFRHDDGGMKGLRKALKEADSVFRKRPEYQAVLDTAEALDQPDDSPILFRKRKDIEQKMAQIERCLEAVNAYAKHKRENYKREMQAARKKGEKAVRQCEEKYKGENSADAKRLRAVAKLKQRLVAWQEDGRKALQLKEELANLIKLRTADEFAERIRQEAENRKMKMPMNSMEKKFGTASAADKKTEFRQPVQQNDLKHSKNF